MARISDGDVRLLAMNHGLTSLKAHSMKRNVVFSFNRTDDVCKKVKEETCANVIKTFLGYITNVLSTGRLFMPLCMYVFGDGRSIQIG